MTTVIRFDALDHQDATPEHPGFEVRFESDQDGELEIIVRDRAGVEARSRVLTVADVVDALRRIDPEWRSE